MTSRIHVQIHNEDGTKTALELEPGSYVIGREATSDIVISSQGVSRKHARLVLSEEAIEIEDLGSRSGTWVGDTQILESTILPLPATLTLGNILIELTSDAVPMPPVITSDQSVNDSGPSICMSMRASVKAMPTIANVSGQGAKRLEMLYELPLQLAEEEDLNTLFSLILTRMLELIPGAVRGAILILEHDTGKLALRASIPENAPPISRTLIHRAITEQHGFIWGDEDEDQQSLSSSMAAIGIRTGMYAPLLWKGETIGVLFVDNPHRSQAFTAEDLRFLLSVAHYAASAVANKLLQDEIEQNNQTLQNLLTNFSPKIRRHLLQKSREGRLIPGGSKSTVTILESDLRGFTKTSASLDSEVVVEMLNDYFEVLGREIFNYDGTIDKFMGDAILAVFGSPEPDGSHAIKAVSAAIEMQNQIDEVNTRRRSEGLPVCEMGIGIFTGEVLHGFIGTKDRLEFTVIGDTVNKAARYCTGAQAGEIVIGPGTYELVKHSVTAKLRMIATKHEGELPAYVVG
ncbi:MAG: adenylate/guanylate cyclase domain-containing protein [Verrucomicrobiota bacterium]